MQYLMAGYQDGKHYFSPGGLLKIKFDRGMILCLFQGDYLWLEFHKAAKPLTDLEKANIGQAIMGRLKPWGE